MAWRNSSVFRLQIVHFINEAAVSAYCERHNLWYHPDLQHVDWIERIILNSPISSWQMAHKSVFVWRSVSSTQWCLLQNDLYLSKNSNRQSSLVAHGRWKLRRHFLSQQLMLAPFLWQKVHFYPVFFPQFHQNWIVEHRTNLINDNDNLCKILPFLKLFSFPWVCRLVENHKYLHRLLRSVVNLSLAAKNKP